VSAILPMCAGSAGNDAAVMTTTASTPRTSDPSHAAGPGEVDEPSVDEGALNAFLGQIVSDLGASLHVLTVVIGDKLGLFRALAEAGPSTSVELAGATDTAERYVREWLRGQAAGGYVRYDATTDRYWMTPEQACVLGQEDSPAFAAGAFWITPAVARSQASLLEAFRTGEGFGWNQHDPDMFVGTDRFFRPGYVANLITTWLPALDGVVERLTAGGTVADLGCGYGSSTVLMAEAFPTAEVVGFDYHPASIAAAEAKASHLGLTNCRFEVAGATDFPGAGYDLVTVFDALHDMGDPVGAAVHIRHALAPEGTWMIVEPAAEDSVEGNLNPVGRVYYNASTMVCVPNSLSQEVGAALGAQAGPAAIEDVVRRAGFGRFTEAARTPFNLVFEARLS
jgi:SAM-dependent methyltransferase